MFLRTVLAIALHNDLTDVAYSQKLFGPNLVTDNTDKKILHSASSLNLTGGSQPSPSAGKLEYYYSLTAIKSKYMFWQEPDKLFMAELGFENIPAFKCINGRDVSNVFRANTNVGLLNTRSHTFHVAQGANIVTEIQVDGPVEDDQNGCVDGLTISQHHISEFVPTGGLPGGPSYAGNAAPAPAAAGTK